LQLNSGVSQTRKFVSNLVVPISPYLSALRSRVGTTRLLLPSVSAHIFDGSGRLLLVRQRENGTWSTPGGLVEPDELPSDAIVRETFEETGLLVLPRQLLGVFGGPDFVVRYPNGDEAQYVITAFGCEVTGGALRHHTEETVEAKYVSEADAAALSLSPWLRTILGMVFSRVPAFELPKWSPAIAEVPKRLAEEE
jgi:ADP-ribose pyrophosphatase YjhB (NUDIX family)